MKSSLRHRTIPLTLSLAGLLLFGGCTTTTRLGDVFIPKHPDSDQHDGEVVRLDVIPVPEAPAATLLAPLEATGTSSVNHQLFGLTSVGGAVAGAAVDWAVSELGREAKRYESQFSSHVLKQTNQIQNPNFLVLTRWVDAPGKTQPSTPANDWVSLISDHESSTSKPVVQTPEKELLAKIAKSAGASTDSLKKKDLAFLFVAQLEQVTSGDDKNPAVFKLEPKLLWDRRTSAKIVNFHGSQIPKFWQWPGALIFKTAPNVNVSIQTTLKTLGRGADGVLKPVTIDPSHPIAAGGTTNLNENESPTELRDGGVWFGVPLIAKLNSTNIGFLSIEFAVTETDASNVRKVVEKGAASLEKRKAGIVDKVGGLFD